MIFPLVYMRGNLPATPKRLFLNIKNYQTLPLLLRWTLDDELPAWQADDAQQLYDDPHLDGLDQLDGLDPPVGLDQTILRNLWVW